MKKSVLIVGMLFGTILSTQAQTATPNVNQKQRNQAVRIQEGVNSGELNRAETASLRKDQRELQRMKKSAKADGDITNRERVALNSKANQNSRKIYRKKHN